MYTVYRATSFVNGSYYNGCASGVNNIQFTVFFWLIAALQIVAVLGWSLRSTRLKTINYERA